MALARDWLPKFLFQIAPNVDARTDPSAGQWVDFTDRLQTAEWSRGRQRRSGDMEAGRARFVLWNGDRVLDPANPASPYYGQLGPMRHVRLACNAYHVAVEEDRPLAYWRMDDAAGSGILADASGNGRHGTVAGGIGQGAGGPGGALGYMQGAGAYQIGGVTNEIAVSVPVGAAFTFEAWVLWDSSQPDGYGCLFANASGSVAAYVRSVASGIGGRIDFNAGVVCRSDTALGSGVWTHVAIVYAAGAVSFYFNGLRDATVTSGAGGSPTTFTWLGNDGGGDHFRGWLDECAFYPTALSPERIKAHYREGAGHGLFRGYTGDNWPLQIGDGDRWTVDLACDDAFRVAAQLTNLDPALVRDDFARVSYPGLGTAPTGQAWATAAGTWEARRAPEQPGGGFPAKEDTLSGTPATYVETGVADVEVAFTYVDALTAGYGTDDIADGMRLVFRYVDNANYLYVENNYNTGLELWQRVAGVDTRLAWTTYWLTSVTPRLRVRALGSAVQWWREGMAVGTAITVTNFQTATKHGLGSTAAGVGNRLRQGWADFRVYAVGAFAWQTRADVRIGAVLDLMGWPASLRNLDAGTYDLVALDIAGTAGLDVLPYLRQVARTDNGYIFCAGDGRITFHNRTHRWDGDRRFPRYAFGNQPGQVALLDAEWDDGDASLLANDVRIARPAVSFGTLAVYAAERRASDAASVARHLPRQLGDWPASLAYAEADVQQVADTTLRRWARPLAGVVGLTAGAEREGGALALANLEIGDTVSATLAPPNGSAPLYAEVYVEQMAHRLTLDALAGEGLGWRCAYRTLQTDLTGESIMPGARVYSTATQAIPNAAIFAVAFEAERWDTDNIHDPATNNTRLTCRTAGRYAIWANIAFTGAVGGLRSAYLRLNGASYIGTQQVPSAGTGGPTVVVVATDYNLSVNDYVEVIVYQDSGAAMNIFNGASYSPEFMMERVG